MDELRNSVRVAAIAAVAVLWAAGAARAQGTTGTPADSAQPRPSVEASLPGGPLLDAPVSRTAYLLGAGDVVELALFGDLNLMYTLPVTPEGAVVIPSVGVVRVLGLNLNEAQARVRAAVLRFYRNVDVSLSLSRVRTFKVFVVGNVPTPGVRVASAATRVSEMLPTSGGVQRNVLLRRATGDTVRIDLVRFTQTGDLSANPTLREGDALIVPTADETVQVYGRVFFAGPYEYRAGETLAELLSVANGGGAFPANAADTVRLTRFTAAGDREFLVLSRADAVGARGRALVLRPGDAIYVAEVANFREQRVATVSGEVARPGVYPIRPDTTTVRELVALAGGLTAEASLATATLRRPTQGRGAAQAATGPTETLSPDELQIRRIRAQGDESNVVIDFQQLFAAGGDAFDQTLRSGDVLTIPERRTEVAVLGAVRTPGLVQFRPGMPASHYIRLAGWYTRRADWRDAVVLRAKLGTPVQASEVDELEAGDVIVVPFRERRTVLERLATTQAVASIASGLLFTFLGLSQVLD
ncbi:MAG: SLBB domain-containing protein [Gemmatimonadetes bacterium]|nr:SLBB domain-containing protein [Gemmatimonadota bacterium]